MKLLGRFLRWLWSWFKEFFIEPFPELKNVISSKYSVKLKLGRLALITTKIVAIISFIVSIAVFAAKGSYQSELESIRSNFMAASPTTEAFSIYFNIFITITYAAIILAAFVILVSLEKTGIKKILFKQWIMNVVSVFVILPILLFVISNIVLFIALVILFIVMRIIVAVFLSGGDAENKGSSSHVTPAAPHEDKKNKYPNKKREYKLGVNKLSDYSKVTIEPDSLGVKCIIVYNQFGVASNICSVNEFERGVVHVLYNNGHRVTEIAGVHAKS